jgi:Secretion system C-terminal sorting domain/FG-GAP-like repeat
MKHFFIIFLILLSQASFGQSQGQVYRQADSAQILQGTNPLPYPWLGGMNCLELTMGDINNDGKKDIVAFDYINRKIFPFINNGLPGTINYMYQPKYAKNFPEVGSYLILKDYNCDGIPDLFHRGLAGVNVSKGYYNSSNELCFTYYRELYYASVFGPVNAYVQPGDIPTITDMDNDGDVDVVAFDVLGNYIVYYKNMRVEDNLPCDSIRIINQSPCWGGVVQNSFFKTYIDSVTCKGFSENGFIEPPIGDQIEWNDQNQANQNHLIKSFKQQRHVGNCMLHLDMDADGDKDALIGSISNNDLQFLRNDGNATNAFIGWQDTLWKSPTEHIYCPLWVATSGEDIDNDGKNDLQFSPHSEKSNTEFYTNNKLQFYRDISSGPIPNFSLLSDSLLFDGTIDFGSYSYPTFFDYDKDGKKDLFVGSAGVMDTSDFQLHASLAYYRNISDTNKIKFELVTKDFLGLAAKKYKGIYPHFADITGEGAADLIMGNNLGQLVVYSNTKVNNYTTPNFVWLTDSFNNIKLIGKYAAPAMFDIDFDGREDLVIGTQSGKLEYYEDTSSIVNVSSFYNKTGSLGVLSAGGNSYSYGYSAPSFTRVDSNNRYQLLIGTGDGTIERYDSLQSNIYGPYQLIDSFYSSIQTLERAVPAFEDIDNDGDYELIVGNKLGGLQFYQQVLLLVTDDTLVIDPIDTATSIVHLMKDKNAFTLWPNPTKEMLMVENNHLHQSFNVVLMNTNGQIVLEQKNIHTKKVEINVSALPAGLYLYKVFDGQYLKTGTLQKQ